MEDKIEVLEVTQSFNVRVLLHKLAFTNSRLEGIIKVLTIP